MNYSSIIFGNKIKLFVNDNLMLAYAKRLLKKEIENKKIEYKVCKEAFDNIVFEHDDKAIVNHFERALSKELELTEFEIREMEAVLEYIESKKKQS